MIHIIETAHAGVISDATPISQIGMNILNFLLSVAGIIAIIFLVASGLRYLLAVGDEKQMVGAKKAAQYAVLGIIMAMGAMVMIKMIGQFFAK